MKITRELNLVLNWVLNEILPPILRDQRWFGWMVTKILYGENAHIYMDFHQNVYEMSSAEIAEVYEKIQSTGLRRATDLNQECVDLLLANSVGTVLEVGCGRGYLCAQLAERHDVTGCDIALDPRLRKNHPNITFVETPAESLPFENHSFDTVISTHMLEHVPDMWRVLRELRRVARKRLLIVVPCERPHYYTPNLHVHFFPYRYSFLLAFRPNKDQYKLTKAGGDWFFKEHVGGVTST